MGNALQKACSIPGLLSPMHFSNNKLSRHKSILRTVLVDNYSDGKAIRLALRDTSSLGKKKCSQGTDVQIITSPHFTVKQTTFDKLFPQRCLCLLMTSLHQLLPSPALRWQCSCLQKGHYSHQSLGMCLPPSALPGISTDLGSCGCTVSPHGDEGLLSASEVEQKDQWCQLLIGKENGRGISLNTSIQWLDDCMLSSLLMS